jgi:hypothetical protein
VSNTPSNAVAVCVGTTEIVLSLGVTSSSSSPHPLKPGNYIVSYAISIKEHNRPIGLSLQMATQCCLLIETGGTSSISSDAQTFVVH